MTFTLKELYANVPSYISYIWLFDFMQPAHCGSHYDGSMGLKNKYSLDRFKNACEAYENRLRSSRSRNAIHRLESGLKRIEDVSNAVDAMIMKRNKNAVQRIWFKNNG